MKLYEYEAYNSLFKKYHIPTPIFMVTDLVTPEVRDFVEYLGKGVVKAQVLVGKRAKAGAVKVGESPRELTQLVNTLSVMDVYGETPRGVVIAEKLDILKEIYVGFTYSTHYRKPILTLSLDGGIDVEDVSTEKIRITPINPDSGLHSFQVKELLLDMGFEYPQQLRQTSDIIARAFRAFWSAEARILEINPLVIARGRHNQEALRIVAADAAVVLDDDGSESPTSIYPPRGTTGKKLTERERMALIIDRDDHRGKAGSYVEMDGDIAMMTFGGGGSTVVAQTSLEIGLKVANLTDIGGNPPAEKMNRIAKIILSKPGIKGVLVCGGTSSNTRIDVTLGEGLASALDELNAEGKLDKDLVWVVRRSGPEYKKGLKMLAECFKRNGIRGEIYDSALPLTEAPFRLNALMEERK
jgi:citryl-CoA synthetase large subunit